MLYILQIVFWRNIVFYFNSENNCYLWRVIVVCIVNVKFVFENISLLSFELQSI